MRRERHGRIEGRRGQVLRDARLQREPLCRDCRSVGRTTAATVIDHIKPLAHGGLDVDSNCRALCRACHEDRTREQFGQRRKPRIGPDGWPMDDAR
ncbi:HNH endonuclease [Novosphingobium tardum]|uniref:HNH endonuclease n=1 Tax=Novosphingobium tardum TaxID=1538021 RepID=A0ABV8RQ07_9SPHN